MNPAHRKYVRSYRSPRFKEVLAYLDEQNTVQTKNTIASYYAKLYKYLKWCRSKNISYIPTLKTCINYIDYLVLDKGYKVSSINNHTHVWDIIRAGLDLDTSSREQKKISLHIKQYKLKAKPRDRAPAQAKPWTNLMTQRLLKEIDPYDIRDVSVVVYILLAYWGGMRGDEVVRVERDDVFIDPNGEQHEVVTWETKTDRSGKGHRNMLPDQVAYWFRHYVDMLPRYSTTLWPHMRGTGAVAHTRMSAPGMANRFKRTLEKYGHHGYTSHSMRSGCAHDMYSVGIDQAAANKHFHWAHNSNTYQRYADTAVSTVAIKMLGMMKEELVESASYD